MTNQDAAAPATGLPDVRPGQVWADNDPRSAGRTLRVDSIENGKAICIIVTDADDVAAHIRRAHECGAVARGSVGRTTRISLARFVPSTTGYRLMRDSEVPS
jgi:hypothetical protein